MRHYLSVLLLPCLFVRTRSCRSFDISCVRLQASVRESLSFCLFFRNAALFAPDPALVPALVPTFGGLVCGLVCASRFLFMALLRHFCFILAPFAILRLLYPAKKKGGLVVSSFHY